MQLFYSFIQHFRFSLLLRPAFLFIFYIFSDDYIYDTTYKSKIVIFLVTLTFKKFFKGRGNEKVKTDSWKAWLSSKYDDEMKKVRKKEKETKRKMFELSYVWEMRKK